MKQTLTNQLRRAVKMVTNYQQLGSTAPSLTAWCREHRLDHSTVWRFMRGADMTLHNADQLARALGLVLKEK